MSMHISHNKKSAFTLIELSVVLVIIGILVGGVIVAQSLVRNSELQTVLADYQRYNSAINQFREKFYTLPGDFIGATQMWGSVSGACTTTTGTALTATCDGNADGYVNAVGGTYTYEQFRAWQHMMNGGFLDVNVNGLMTATYNKTPGTNVPAAGVGGAGWALTYLAQSSTDAVTSTDDTVYGHVLWLGGTSTNSTTNLTSGVLTTVEAKALDDKIDDGKANSGRMVAENDTGSCIDATPVYNVSVSGKVCSLVFKTGY